MGINGTHPKFEYLCFSHVQKTFYVTLLSPSMSRLFKFFKNIKAWIDKIQQTKHQRSITVISENNINLKWNLSNTFWDKTLNAQLRDKSFVLFIANKFLWLKSSRGRTERLRPFQQTLINRRRCDYSCPKIITCSISYITSSLVMQLAGVLLVINMFYIRTMH